MTGVNLSDNKLPKIKRQNSPEKVNYSIDFIGFKRRKTKVIRKFL